MNQSINTDSKNSKEPQQKFADNPQQLNVLRSAAGFWYSNNSLKMGAWVDG